MVDPQQDLDLQGVARLISGEGIGPERQAKIHAIGQKLGVRTDDPMFAMLVLLEVNAALFSGVPDRMAAAAKEAAADVGEAARETANRILAEAVTSNVDMQLFNRHFRRWAIGTVLGTLLVVGCFSIFACRLVNDVTASAQSLYREEVAQAKASIEVERNATIRASTEAATQAAIVAAQATAKAYEDKLAADLKNSVDQRVADGLKFGQANASLVGDLLRLEAQQPGFLTILNRLASAGWQALVRANPNGPCPGPGYDPNQQRKTCTLWMQ